MGRPRSSVPKYSHHKATGLARVWLDGKYIYLGPYNSPESLAEYNRIRAEYEVKAVRGEAVTTTTGTRTVNELVDAFLRHAETHYRDSDGELTSEMGWLADSTRLLLELYGHTPAAEFGPLALKALRNQWIVSGRCRKSCNARTNRVRRIFKWAASEELVPFPTFQALTTVTGLQAGRSEAKDRSPITPVLDLHLVAAIPEMMPTLRAMVLVQRLTGMRPGEVRKMKVGQVDRGSSPWVYTPRKHKTEHHGRTRQILIGPRAAEILQPFLDGRAVTDVVFSPVGVKAERNAAKRAARKTPVQPSQKDRAKPLAARKKLTPEMFTRPGYASAIARCCRNAGIPPWQPNQLRHKFATEVRSLYGLEAAQVLLGHSKADVTQVYAERNSALGKQVAAAMG